MHSINGYVIITFALRDEEDIDSDIVILGARESDWSATGYEYMTAVVKTLNDEQWVAGHYTHSLDMALVDFNLRAIRA